MLGDARKIYLDFDCLDYKIYFYLDERNHELCEAIWNSLPFTVIIEHSLVSGKSFYGWVPFVYEGDIPIKIIRTESPIGWVGYNQGTGHKISIKYGEISEDLYGNSLGFVPSEFYETLHIIGTLVWNNYFSNKNIIRLTFDK